MGTPDGRTVVALEVLDGAGPFAVDEVAAAIPDASVLASAPTEVQVAVDDPRDLLALRTVVAAYLLLPLDVRRPRGLLSPDRLQSCADAVRRAREVAKPARFRSFRVSAAGRDSPELLRLRAELAEATGLVDDPEDGDMLLRLRRQPPERELDRGPEPEPQDPAPARPGPSGPPPSRSGPLHPEPSTGWELLVRLTPRPLSARPWRVADYPGALNATVAAAVVAATDPSPDDRVVDLMCGSGTLVIERLARGVPRRLVACDISPEALDAARANQRAARLRGRVEHVRADARELAAHLPGDRFDRLMANLPWGELVGSHEANEELYPAVLSGARELAAPEAQLALVTHDIRRFERSLEQVGGWTVTGSHRFFQKGHRPKLYLLRPEPVSGGAWSRHQTVW